jgi:glycosyltransferase involved in cell wall biosynthesis
VTVTQVGRAPVALFTYNRPEHTQKVLDSLAHCKGAEETVLFLFSDGPKAQKGPEEADLVCAVRQILQNENRFAQVRVIERTENLGLGRSIITGVNEVMADWDRVIVLEDDLVVHPDFLIYMNYYLNLYRDEPSIYHISGFQKESWLQFFLKPVYISGYMNCSGWATWKNRWNQLTVDIVKIENYLSTPENRNYFDYGVLEVSEQLKLNRERLATWAVFWYATIRMVRGLCVNPKYSFVYNIGDDGTGTNMGVTEANTVRNPAFQFRPFRPERLKEDFWEHYHIREAYAKKSKVKLKTIKKPLFRLLGKLRSYFIVSSSFLR